MAKYGAQETNGLADAGIKGRSLSSQIIDHAKKDGVFAKGVGILSCISTLN